jgi:tetratricopeptide (TPR) repeat protein
MNRENVLFLLAGLVFGILIGVGSYHAVRTVPDLDTAAPAAGGGARAAVAAQPSGVPQSVERKRLERELRERPRDPVLLVKLADLHYDEGMWEQAAGYYERAVQVRPHPDVLTDLGICYRELGEYERALEHFAQAHELDPSHWQSLYNTMVVTAFDIGRYDQARQALDAMEAIEPRPAELDPARLDQLREMLDRLAGAPERPS